MATRKRLSASSKKRSNAISRKYWNRLHKRTKGTKCVMQTTKKYLSRPSPPYPANKCCGMKKIGNDGAKYVAEPSANGICAWKKI